jgi:hypothetical protein
LEELDVGITSKWVLKNRIRGCGLDSSGSHSVKLQALVNTMILSVL